MVMGIAFMLTATWHSPLTTSHLRDQAKVTHLGSDVPKKSQEAQGVPAQF
jgi:hypothetical protein